MSSITGFPGMTSMLPVAGPARCNAILVTALLSSPLEDVGESDITSHVEWTSLAERAEERSLNLAGFTDQHHFLTGLLLSCPDLASAVAEKSRALQTLLHPEFLGTKFQFLALTKEFPAAEPLGGFKFARDGRQALGLSKVGGLCAPMGLNRAG